MNKKLFFILFYIFIILFIVLFTIFFYQNKYLNLNDNKETFQNNCNKFFKGKTFCQLNINNNKCECKYQKDGINYPFDAPEPCCDNKCSKIKPENCHEPNPKLESSYYCNIAGKCIEYKGTIKNNRISENNCGLDPLNNQLLLGYITKEECESQNNPCDKYNKYNMSTMKKKNFCLKDTNCGFCTNSYGDGKCIDGNASGPNDILKYFDCIPQQKNTDSSKNRYEYGDRALYLL